MSLSHVFALSIRERVPTASLCLLPSATTIVCIDLWLYVFDLSVSHLRLTADVTIIGRSRAVSRARTRSRGPRRDHDATRRDAPAASRHAKRAARATDFRAFV